MLIENDTDVSDAGGIKGIVSETVVVPFEISREATGVGFPDGDMRPPK